VGLDLTSVKVTWPNNQQHTRFDVRLKTMAQILSNTY